MRVLFITYRFYPYIGGIEVNSEILSNEFVKCGHDVKVITTTSDSDIEISRSFNVIRNSSLVQLFKLYLWADIVFENNPSLNLSWPNLFINKPHVIAIRTWVQRMDGKKSWQDKLKLWWLKRADATIAISEAVRKQASDKATVIGNPYRTELFKIKPDINRNKTFVFVGRLVSDKGVDIALQAFEKFVSQVDKSSSLDKTIHFTIIGDGPEREKLIQLTKELQLEKHVTFTGTLKGNELVDCINQHDIFLVPSKWEEPFGNVALEGMACGCIPIVSDGGGLTDAVGNAGLVFKRGDSHDLYTKMLLLMEDQALATQLKQNGYAHLQNHRPEFVAERYLEIIKSVM
jgi:glycosyltransferase involved in cell wall biosynthesis